MTNFHVIPAPASPELQRGEPASLAFAKRFGEAGKTGMTKNDFSNKFANQPAV